MRHTEYLGADTVVTCEAGDARLLVRVPGLAAIAEGSQVHLATDEELHVFDAATGQRVTPAHVAREETVP